MITWSELFFPGRYSPSRRRFLRKSLLVGAGVVFGGTASGILSACGCEGPSCNNPPVTPDVIYYPQGPPPTPALPQAEATSAVKITRPGLVAQDTREPPQTADRAARVGCKIEQGPGDTEPHIDPNCKTLP